MLLGQKLQNSLKHHGVKNQYSNHHQMGNKINHNSRRVLHIQPHKQITRSSPLEKN